MTSATRRVVIINKQGLHARPIAMIAETAGRFDSSLSIAVEGREVDGRSILAMMTLCASQGAEMELRAEGKDAQPLVDAVADVVERGFDEL